MAMAPGEGIALARARASLVGRRGCTGGSTGGQAASGTRWAWACHPAEHYRKEDFRSELLRILRAHGVEFDERYVFD